MAQAHDLNERIVAAQADALFATIVPSAAIGLAGAILVAATMLGTPAAPAAEIFVVAAALILGVRLVIRALYRRHGHDRPQRWLDTAAALILVSGLLWGAMMFWATRAATDPQLLVATTVTLGAVVIALTLAAYWPAHLAFHLPASILAAAGFLTSGRAGHLPIGVAAIILCGAMALAGRRLGTHIMRSIRLSAENAELVAELGNQTAELNRANDDLEQCSRTDVLTGLANRRTFTERLDLHWALATRLKRPIALLAIDIDGFEKYRDDFGAAAGDLCLQAVADVLASSARGTTDLAARLGGEEFALILPDTGEDAALLVAERIRTTVGSFTLEPTAELPSPVTVSIGVAAMNPADGGEPVGALIEQATLAVGRAKQAGRNGVATSG